MPFLRVESDNVRARAKAVILTLVLAVSMLWPAVLNHSPIIHPDTLGYFRAGEHVFQVVGSVLGQRSHAAPDSGATVIKLNARGDHFGPERSVYYGAFLVGLFSLGGGWLVIFAQSLLLTVTVQVALSKFSPRSSHWPAVIWAGLVLVSGLPFFVSTMMPDVFAGGMILAITVILSPGDPPPAPGRLLLYALVGLAVIFHTSHLALAAALVVLVSLGQWGLGRRPGTAAVGLVAIILAGALASALVGIAAERLTREPVVIKPFVLARLQSDGPLADYLARRCPAHPYALCRFRDRLPEPVNDFLWSKDPRRGVLALADVPEQQRLSSEARGIIIGTILDYPVRQGLASAGDFLQQFSMVGVSEYGQIGPDNLDAIAPTSAFFGTARRYVEAGAAKRAMLGPESVVMMIAYFASILLLAGLAARRFRRDNVPALAWLRNLAGEAFPAGALIAVVGVIANAAICGALSGVFDRYQGRVAWVVVLLACLAIARQRWSVGDPAAA